jgi:four helix bundle protein
MYKELSVWKQSFSLVIFIYKITGNFPKNELFGLISQIRRSAVSIPSNIAEGKGRKSDKAFLYFLHIANGSLFELRTQIDISYSLGYLNTEMLNDFNKQADAISKMLSSIIKKLKAKS